MQSGNEASYNIRVKLSQRYIYCARADDGRWTNIWSGGSRACWAGSYAPAYVSEILVRRSPGLPDLFLRPCTIQVELALYIAIAVAPTTVYLQIAYVLYVVCCAGLQRLPERKLRRNETHVSSV